ncbi:MAG: M23 family metallopeptidase [Acidimicrobiia bacterium]|nr:M23 family metallopeptidase [Acidimicrobiia bacterium]
MVAGTMAWVRRLGALAAGASIACSNPAGPSPVGPGSGPGPGVPSLVDCGSFTDSAASPYVLPFEVGRSFLVSRTFGHYLPSNGGVGLYALDVIMPIGTPVHAIRGGVVVAVEERFSNDDHADYHENWVMVRHADDTIARYIHLTTNGALVDVGSVVGQGQVVGLSGNSGASNEPHLHFDVQRCGPNIPPRYNDLPCGMTVPLSFRNTEPHSCGLQARKTYRALPFDRGMYN